ncbi:UPF0220-domain-containing protein [Ramicandelaber brevisporus]|nr:UPF0220-domain-containing protein [Ramicandelaber brevisporus]
MSECSVYLARLRVLFLLAVHLLLAGPKHRTFSFFFLIVSLVQTVQHHLPVHSHYRLAPAPDGSRSSSMPRRHPFVCRWPRLPAFVQDNIRSWGTYAAGALFTLGWWCFIDGIAFAKTTPDFPVRVSIEDYLPGIFTTLGMIITNSIDISLLNDDGGGGGFGAFDDSSSLAGKAKLTLFIGIALIAGGLAGSVAILAIKYLAADVASKFIYTALATVVQNVLIVMCSVMLWIVHSIDADSQYNFILH